MEDKDILDLYWERSESAIAETTSKYGRYCHYIANNILHSNEDSEECVNDTCLKAWETIPPQRPSRFAAYLGEIIRNLALDRYRRYSREKRGGSQVPLVYEELAEFSTATDNTAHIADEIALTDCMNRFLASLPAERRKIFVRRYWHLSPVKEIAADFSLGESKVKMILHRTRKELKQLLEKEGLL